MDWKAPMPLLARPSGPPQLWVQVADVELSAVAQADIVWTEPLALLRLRLSHVVPVTNSVVLQARTSPDAGSTFDAGASDYSYHRVHRWSTQSLTNSAGASVVPLTDIVGNNAGYGATGDVWLFSPGDAKQTCAYSSIVYRDAANNAIWVSNRFTRLSAAKVDGLRLFFASGNIASGRVTARGLLEHGRGA